MRARRAVGVFLLMAVGCGPLFTLPPPTACSDEASNEAIEGSVDFGEFFQRHDDYLQSVTNDAGVKWHASARHGGGRLFLRLHPTVTSGTLPRPVVSSAGCALTEIFRYRDDADGKLHNGTLTMTVLDGGVAGTPFLDVELSNMSFSLADGGSSLLLSNRITWTHE